jgi:hypothetical protein
MRAMTCWVDQGRAALALPQERQVAVVGAFEQVAGALTLWPAAAFLTGEPFEVGACCAWWRAGYAS